MRVEHREGPERSLDTDRRLTATERRSSLLEWMRERPEHSGLTTAEIVDVIGHPYDKLGHGRYDRCFDDLNKLAIKRQIRRLGGRPARWSA